MKYNMDFFFNIDWQQLKNLVNDLELLCYNTPEYNGKSKLELTKLLYLIESDLTEIKTKLNLPLINSSIRSESVVKSFQRIEEYSQIFQEHDIIFNNFLRQNDYQYWLLIFLLLKNNEIRSKNLSLYQIIDEFISRIQSESFNLEDIEYTGSGATRCITNIRFAFNDLKELGLVSLYDRENKNSWTLTFVGFFIAASFCLYPVDKDEKPLSKKLTHFHQSTYYHKINRFLLDRTKDLSNPEYFKNIVHEIKLDSLKLKELERGPEIFEDYYKSLISIFEKEKNDKARTKKLADYLKILDTKYPLSKYMEELSLKYDAEAFLNELIHSLK